MKKSASSKRPRLKVPGKTITWVESPESLAWERMQVLTEHWQSDLKFFQDEIRFLDNLIGRYFLWLIEEDNIEKTRQIAKGFNTLQTNRQEIEKSVIKHQQHYRGLLENPFSSDSQKFKKEHGRLESDMAAFVIKFKNLKREAFQLTEKVIESEKVKHLISRQ